MDELPLRNAHIIPAGFLCPARARKRAQGSPCAWCNRDCAAAYVEVDRQVRPRTHAPLSAKSRHRDYGGKVAEPEVLGYCARCCELCGELCVELRNSKAKYLVDDPSTHRRRAGFWSIRSQCVRSTLVRNVLVSLSGGVRPGTSRFCSVCRKPVFCMRERRGYVRQYVSGSQVDCRNRDAGGIGATERDRRPD